MCDREFQGAESTSCVPDHMRLVDALGIEPGGEAIRMPAPHHDTVGAL
jgi:hypothetical protein